MEILSSYLSWIASVSGTISFTYNETLKTRGGNLSGIWFIFFYPGPAKQFSKPIVALRSFGGIRGDWWGWGGGCGGGGGGARGGGEGHALVWQGNMNAIEPKPDGVASKECRAAGCLFMVLQERI